LQLNVTTPIIVDLGLTRIAEVDALLASGGTLGEEVREALRLVGTRIDVDRGKRTLVPVVVTYSRRRTRPKRAIRVVWSNRDS